MTEDAVRIQAALDEHPKSETEISLAAGVGLVDTRRALDELSILGAAEEVGSDLREWVIAGGSK